jgi:hypothetical protein
MMNISTLFLFRIARHNSAVVRSYFGLSLSTLLFAFLPHESSAQSPQPSPVFYKTQNSDECVKHTLRVQKLYSRLLVVDGSGKPPRRIRIGNLSLNARDKDEAAPIRRYKVYAAYKTLQEAERVTEPKRAFEASSANRWKSQHPKQRKAT